MRETHLRQGRQTVKLGLIKVVQDLFPEERLKTSYSILEGVFCHLDGSVLSTREVRLIGERLAAWVQRNEPIQLLGRAGGYYVYDVDGLVVNALYPALTAPAEVEPFTLVPFSDGFIVDFGDADKGADLPLIPPVKLQATYTERRRWLAQVGITVVGDVNAYIRSGQHQELISISEALHEKKISLIADSILAEQRALRVLLIAGPTSSGKTSFLRRLNTQLLVNGFQPVGLSLDNYFVDRDATPLGPDGKPDFDVLDALDLPLLREHISRLVEGERIEVPRFDFVTGQRSPVHHPLQVGPHQILVIEGLHALNPELVGRIHRNQLYKIHVSPLGGLNIDLVNRVPTTEVRLIRRMVRDDRSRGISPERTLDQWSSVRRGEYDCIFRFQEDADAMFNSSMVYELNALRRPAEAVLDKIGDNSPHRDTRDRLLNLLSFFDPIDTSKVPFNSLLREFIGGSLYAED
ncbi:uridine kinase [Raineyella antarctica]|uniref:Uridine kinase n=1 Tax=Raineyella antarctica TaxID=1577474 RepID=A0A1G6H3H2_9ACTN|nr:nucleoside kinase [Raineyella antarctica]SDB88741.1 uridine kinase [Raineyella antarctica]